MKNRNFYIDLQLSKLPPEKQNILRKQVSSVDYSLFDALNHLGGESSKGEISPIGAVDTVILLVAFLVLIIAGVTAYYHVWYAPNKG